MTRRTRRKLRGEAGFALPGALLAIFLLSIALGLVAASLQLRMVLVQREARALVLNALSDAAVAEALARLTASDSFRGEPAHAFGGGSLSSEVHPVTKVQFELVATATYAGRTRIVEATVVRPIKETARVVRWHRKPGL